MYLCKHQCAFVHAQVRSHLVSERGTALLQRFQRQQTVSVLLQAPAFSFLNTEDIQRFVACCETVVFQAGEMLIKKGERGARMCILLEVRRYTNQVVRRLHLQ